VEHLDRGQLDELVEVQPHDRRRAAQLLLESRELRAECRVRRRGGRRDERHDEADEDDASHRCGGPASGERWPNTGARSRSEKSITDSAITDTANAALRTIERGRKTSASGKSAAPISVQPTRWCRNAERAKNHPFCSCTRNAAPETARPIGVASFHQRLFSFPYARPSSAAPIAISACAQAPWATMWIAEFVKNVITGHIRIPSPNARPGQRYARQARRSQTSRPTIASASFSRPSQSRPMPKSQCTISLGGCIGLQVGDKRPCDEHGEDDSREDDEQRRLDDEPPETLPVRVEQGQPVRLDDRPDDPGGDRQRPEQRDRAGAPARIGPFSR